MLSKAPLDPGLRLVLVDGVTPSLVSGRLMGSPSRPDHDEHRSARVRFEETTAESWNTRRIIRFELSEGALIRSVEFTKFSKLSEPIETGRIFCNLSQRVQSDSYSSSVTVDGNSFTISGLEKDRQQYKDLSSMEFILYLSLKPGFSGNVLLDAMCSWRSSDEYGRIAPIKIAKAYSPLFVNAVVTNVNSKDDKLPIVKSAPIELRESSPGSLCSNAGRNRVEIVLFNDGQACSARFASQPQIQVLEGDLRIKNAILRGGIIRFDVERSSTVPSWIVVSNISVEIDCHPEESLYKLCVGGPAISANSKHIADPHLEPDPRDDTKQIPVTKELFDTRGIEADYILYSG